MIEEGNPDANSVDAPTSSVITAPLADAGSYSDEDAFNCDTDKFDKRKVKVVCPHCHNVSAPLASYKTTELNSGWRWCGCDHKEPFTTFKAKCRKCHKHYRFTVYTPQ
jgi:hypothetical protein